MIKRYYFYKLIIGIFWTLCPDHLPNTKLAILVQAQRMQLLIQFIRFTDFSCSANNHEGIGRG